MPTSWIKRTHIQNTLVFGLALIFSLLIAELVVSIAIPSKPIQSGWNWTTLPFEKYKAPDAKSNQLGYKGQTIEYSPDDFVVILVGDSQVESAALDMRSMPEALLQSQLKSRNVKVFSLGASGWGQDQQYLAISNYFEKYRADLVIVWATPVNDLWENTFPDRSAGLRIGPFKPTFSLRNGQLDGPDFLNSFSDSSPRLIEVLLKLTGFRGIFIRNQWVKNHLPPPDLSTRTCDAGQEISQKDFMDQIHELPSDGKYHIKTREQVSKGRSHFSNFIQQPSKLNDYQVQLTQSLYSRMIALSVQNNAEFLTFVPLRSDENKLKQVDCIIENGVGQFPFAFDPENLMRQLVPVRQLAVRKISVSKDDVVSIEDQHLNAKGNTKAMDALASEILQRGYLNDHK